MKRPQLLQPQQQQLLAAAEAPKKRKIQPIFLGALGSSTGSTAFITSEQPSTSTGFGQQSQSQHHQQQCFEIPFRANPPVLTGRVSSSTKTTTDHDQQNISSSITTGITPVESNSDVEVVEDSSPLNSTSFDDLFKHSQQSASMEPFQQQQSSSNVRSLHQRKSIYREGEEDEVVPDSAAEEDENTSNDPSSDDDDDDDSSSTSSSSGSSSSLSSSSSLTSSLPNSVRPSPHRSAGQEEEQQQTTDNLMEMEAAEARKAGMKMDERKRGRGDDEELELELAPSRALMRRHPAAIPFFRSSRFIRTSPGTTIAALAEFLYKSAIRSMAAAQIKQNSSEPEAVASSAQEEEQPQSIAVVANEGGREGEEEEDIIETFSSLAPLPPPPSILPPQTAKAATPPPQEEVQQQQQVQHQQKQEQPVPDRPKHFYIVNHRHQLRRLHATDCLASVFEASLHWDRHLTIFYDVRSPTREERADLWTTVLGPELTKAVLTDYRFKRQQQKEEEEKSGRRSGGNGRNSRNGGETTKSSQAVQPKTQQKQQQRPASAASAPKKRRIQPIFLGALGSTFNSEQPSTSTGIGQQSQNQQQQQSSETTAFRANPVLIDRVSSTKNTDKQHHSSGTTPVNEVESSNSDVDVEVVEDNFLLNSSSRLNSTFNDLKLSQQNKLRENGSVQLSPLPQTASLHQQNIASLRMPQPQQRAPAIAHQNTLVKNALMNSKQRGIKCASSLQASRFGHEAKFDQLMNRSQLLQPQQRRPTVPAPKKRRIEPIFLGALGSSTGTTFITSEQPSTSAASFGHQSQQHQTLRANPVLIDRVLSTKTTTNQEHVSSSCTSSITTPEVEIVEERQRLNFKHSQQNGFRQLLPEQRRLENGVGRGLSPLPQTASFHQQNISTSNAILPTPQLQRELTIKIDQGDEQTEQVEVDQVLVRNVLMKPECANIQAKFRGEVKWEQTVVGSPVLLIQANLQWTVSAHEDGRLVVFCTQTGTVRFSSLSIADHDKCPVAVLELSDDVCMTISTRAELTTWDLRKGTRILRASLKTPLIGCPQGAEQQIVRTLLFPNGVPALLLRNWEVLVFSRSLDSWLSMNIIGPDGSDLLANTTSLSSMQFVAEVLPDGLTSMLIDALTMRRKSKGKSEEKSKEMSNSSMLEEQAPQHPVNSNAQQGQEELQGKEDEEEETASVDAAANEEAQLEQLLRATIELHSAEEYRLLAGIYLQKLLKRGKLEKMAELVEELRALPADTPAPVPLDTVLGDIRHLPEANGLTIEAICGGEPPERWRSEKKQKHQLEKKAKNGSSLLKETNMDEERASSKSLSLPTANNSNKNNNIVSNNESHHFIDL